MLEGEQLDPTSEKTLSHFFYSVPRALRALGTHDGLISVILCGSVGKSGGKRERGGVETLGIEPKGVSSSAGIMDMAVVVWWGEVGRSHDGTLSAVGRCAVWTVDLGGRGMKRSGWGRVGTALGRSSFGRE